MFALNTRRYQNVRTIKIQVIACRRRRSLCTYKTKTILSHGRISPLKASLLSESKSVRHQQSTSALQKILLQVFRYFFAFNSFASIRSLQAFVLPISPCSFQFHTKVSSQSTCTTFRRSLRKPSRRLNRWPNPKR